MYEPKKEEPKKGFFDMFKINKDESAKTRPPTMASMPSPVQTTVSDVEKKNACLASADKKAKEAAEDKKKCETDFPRKKFLGFFGGKKRKSKSKRCKSKKTNKKRKHATKKSSR